MQIALTLAGQVLIMFLLAGIGFGLFKGGKISQEGSKCIGNLLIYVVLPCVIMNGFLVERTKERITGLLLSALLAFVILLISIAVSSLLFKKDAIAAFAVVWRSHYDREERKDSNYFPLRCF